MSRIVIVTDAWHPQVNGVVRTIDALRQALIELDHTVVVIAPDAFPGMPLPTYPEIRMAVATPWQVGRRIREARPDFVHIATEGPLGWLARHWCRRHRRSFTTSYHTRFPEYLSARVPVREGWIYALLRMFHNAGEACMVATPSLGRELSERGFRHLVPWTRGVDAETFRPRPKDDLGLKRPIFLSVGRLAVEKNLPAFLSLDLPGSKVVIGDGPERASLEAAFPEAHFLGARFGDDLARLFAAADVFVFPSLTDTFGNVVLEALASGVPVAAFPVTGPIDIIGDAPVGVLDNDLGHAARAALALSPEACRAHALGFTWKASAGRFLANLMPAEPSGLPRRSKPAQAAGGALRL
ncbi:glycosyltransferase family 4 protein [Marinivivus vitaminiproducens]|uniref:glycosyltransferase family 4 protein n=1 Tax=Marinivivus vitaminiproducens TaxID=3035935 RepID=UPI00279B92DA|nr:glycosyltransferase family 1 protein [Geminicoccaceae bacterium SCSIO 64248]